jgi:hypothetical protein
MVFIRQLQRLRAPQLQRAVLTARGDFAAVGRPINSEDLQGGQPKQSTHDFGTEKTILRPHGQADP